MRFTRIPARMVRIACVAAALAAAGSALALDKSGLILVAADNTPAAPVNSAPGMPGRADPDRGAAPDMSVDKTKRAVEDSAITTRIKTKLLTTKDLKSTGIHVKTQQGTVDVSGTVPSQQQHDMVLDAIRSVEGVTSVNDKLKVSSR
ncbi:BON domain-containing protein [Cupriavidus necator]|uniref:BON domain-containing protein n=1 Tax=Cupriavidus necator TaxID=106590 RepID=A0A367P6J8_CUPNE|nr:BON domain-containing protein [Cupriavidus necator]QQX87184.1 BON domain-containing protein [Cupriavidus necator]RCJ03451.1 BON domain-containing protein [Cupriavidus necator]